jgi:MFS family permease
MKKYITRTVWILSFVSLLTDAASEMLYPVMPIYLKSIGFSMVLIGVLEGVAEALAGLSKGYFGKWSDLSGKRLPFVQLGYSLSALSKPLMAASVLPLWVFFARSVDRLGKGIRTGARDALLSDEATTETKGRVFGFHRSMDTLGAVIGPCIALLYLYFYPSDYRNLFFLALVPGLLSIAATSLLRESTHTPKPNATKPNFFSFLGYWKESPLAYQRLVLGLLAFAAINSSDVFLLLQARACGISDTQVIALYIFYNLVYAISAYPIGILSDRLGIKRTFIFGLGLFAIVYGGMAASPNLPSLICLFAIYGLYAACTEGLAKAWISNICAKKDTATAIGTYTGYQSICALFASSASGMIWYAFGAEYLFLLSALGAVCVIFYLYLRVESV